MGFSSMVFFIGITMVLFAKSELEKRHSSYYPYNQEDEHENDLSIQTSRKIGSKPALNALLSTQEFRKIPKESPYSHYRSSSLKSLTSQQGSTECPALRKTLVIELLHILSPDIILQSDPFFYLVDNVMKISSENFPVVSRDLRKQLKNNRLPKCYIPFARVLFSLLECGDDLSTLKHIIKEIQKLYSSHDNDYSSFRSYIDSSTSPELLELYSDDILDDPKPPMRLLYKLLDMPKSSKQNLKTQLKNIEDIKLKKIRFLFEKNKANMRYTACLLRLLQKESILDYLKRDVALIPKTSTSEEQLSAASVDSSETQVQDEITANK